MLEDFFLMFSYLELELISGKQTGKRMIISFGQKIHRACLGEHAETIENLGCVLFKLIDHDPGN